MTIDDAISMLEAILLDRKPYEGSSGNDAIRLGIEALKRVRKEREIQGGLYNYDLIGED